MEPGPRLVTRSAISVTGSTAVDEVVPTVATTAAAPAPVELCPERVGPQPELPVHRDLHDLETEHPHGLLDRGMRVLGASTRSPPVTCRAAISAASVDVEAESSMCPCQDLREAEQLGEPVQHVELELRRGR